MAAAREGELEPIPGTSTLWAELRWAARNEGVVHLDDLLPRRVRLGLLAPHGGAALLPRIRAICQPELGWDDACWLAEQAGYLALWRKHYSLPDPAAIPDWRAMLAQARAQREARAEQSRRVRRTMAATVGAAVGLGMVLFARRARRRQVRNS